MGEGKFSNADHLMALREERRDKQIWYYVNDAKLKELITDLDETDLFLILHSKSTGAWLNVRDTTVTGIVLAATEFIDI